MGWKWRGKGSIFFTIPYQTDAEKNGSDKGILSGKLICEDISRRLKILAVDDNKISRLLISAIKENSKALLEQVRVLKLSILAQIMLTLI
jgi:hypothetical protein